MKLFILFFLSLSLHLYASTSHFISLDKQVKYKKDFKHFDYVNPNAKKGSTFKRASVGTFDSLNPFILKGISADGIGYIYDSLTRASLDEVSTYYSLIAQEVELDPDNKWVVFHLNPKAKFSDGVQITAEDVKFTFELLLIKASPTYRQYYADVKDVQVLNDLSVKFNFKTNKNNELALILGTLKILPKHFWENKDFKKSSKITPIGSGPYKIKNFAFGKHITYERDKNYWAKDLNVNIGFYNFDILKYEYYKDQTVSLEAFKSGSYDFIQEYTAKTWATMYKGKKFDNKTILKENRKHFNPQGMQAFIFNTRNPLFKNIEVRRALNLAFDFEWSNKQLFYSQYKRSNSYFSNSALASFDLPSKQELKLLNPLKDLIPKEVFTSEFKNNVTKGDGKIRKELRRALKLLKKQGWKFKNKLLVKDGKKFEFTILIRQDNFQRVLQPFIKNLKKIGITAEIKLLDIVSYKNKANNYDYDMMIISYPVSLTPGNELKYFWGSKAAKQKGNSNYIGIQNKAIDTLINEVIVSQNRDDLISSVRALDRVMLHNYYLISNWHSTSFRIAYFNKFNQPKIKSPYSIGLDTWWAKDKYLKESKK